MKKFIALLSFILMTMILLIGCNKTAYDVSINTDIDTYHLAISIVQGITMTPEFKTNDENINVEFKDGVVVIYKDNFNGIELDKLKVESTGLNINMTIDLNTIIKNINSKNK